MEKSNSNLTPLLKGEIEGDYQDLIKNKNKVLKLIENLNTDIETYDFKNKRHESISAIKEKFEDLEKNMKKYSQGLNYINSYYDNNKNEKNKIFIRPAINIDRKTINNKINKDFQMNNNLNANTFIRKESKYYFIYLL